MLLFVLDLPNPIRYTGQIVDPGLPLSLRQVEHRRLISSQMNTCKGRTE